MKLVKVPKAIKTKAKVGTVEAIVEVPQYESIEEFVQIAGGEDKFVAWGNRQVARSAISSSRSYGPNAAETATVDEIAAKMQELASGYNFASARGAGSNIKAKAEKFDAVQAIVKSGNYTQEQLLAALDMLS